MKKQILSGILVLAILLSGTISQAASNGDDKKLTPQEKIVKDFNTEFLLTPTITPADNGFIASSVVDEHNVSAAYNKKGNRVYSIVHYTAGNLDKNIVDAVKTGYDKYFITSMEKVEEPGFKPVYMVHLTNANSIKTVRVTDGGGLELMQNFRKI